MADPFAEEFASWLRPRDALSRLGVAGEANSKNEIAARILQGSIRMAALSSSKAGHKQERTQQPSLIDPNYLHRPWVAEWAEFWSLGQVLFVFDPTPLEGFAVLNIVGSTGSIGQPEIHIFHGVRLDPVAMFREFDLDLLPGTAVPQREGSAAARKGGRPAGMHGEPIARVTLRLSAMSVEEFRTYTAEALSVELIEEFRAEGLKPPSDVNALRDAAGILRVLRG
jgi:hypothetical protein